MSELTKFLNESFVFSGKNKFYFLRTKYRTLRQSFQEIYQYSKKLEILLTQNGAKKGDKIIIKAPNMPQWVIVFITCLRMGYVLVPIDYKSDFDFDIKIINLVNPKFIFYSIENDSLNLLADFFDLECFYGDNAKKNIINLKKNFNNTNNECNIIFLEDFEEVLNNYKLKNLKFNVSLKKGKKDLNYNKDYNEDYIYEDYIYNEDFVKDDDIAEIVFTSGSTSIPKGVILTHKNISSNLNSAKPIIKKWQSLFKLMINPKLLSLVPLSHMYGQVIGIFIPLMIGSSVVFLNSINPEEILKAIKKEKIWILGVLPKLASIIKNHIIKKYNLDSKSFKDKYKKVRNIKWWIRFVLFLGLKIKIGWRLVAIISGGAPIDYDTEDFFRCLAYSFFQGYGLTETAPLITLTDPSKNKQGSVGSFLENQQIKIIDGELYIKGENVFKGYYGLDKQDVFQDVSQKFSQNVSQSASNINNINLNNLNNTINNVNTAANFLIKNNETKNKIKEINENITAKDFTEDGWFKTGDIVEVNRNGDVFVKGRVDDLIVRPDGLKIYPYDIENIIKSVSDKIKDCVIFSVQKPYKESLKLFEKDIVSKGGLKQEIFAVLLIDFKKYPDIKEQEINDLILKSNSKLNPYQKIDSFIVWDQEDFPRTSTLKPKKNEIKKVILEKLNSQISSKTIKKNEVDFNYQNENDENEAKFTDKKDIEELKVENLFKILSEVQTLKINNLKDDFKLQDDLGLDSLDIIELSSAIEEKFDINSDNLIITKDTSLKDLKNFIINPPEKSFKIPFYSFPYNYIFVILRTIFQFILFPFISILYRRRYAGRQNLKNLILPTVFASNHVSLIDTFVILYSLPIRIRLKLTTVMSIEHHFLHFFNKTGNVFRRLFEAICFYVFICLFLNVIPLSRTHGYKQSLENIGYMIDKGFNILIFPEGAITIDGNIKEFEPGIGIIAKEMKVPIVPIRIDGLHDILHNGILPLKHPPKIPLVKINFGNQISELEGTYKEIADKLRNIILKL